MKRLIFITFCLVACAPRSGDEAGAPRSAATGYSMAAEGVKMTLPYGADELTVHADSMRSMDQMQQVELLGAVGQSAGVTVACDRLTVDLEKETLWCKNNVEMTFQMDSDWRERRK